jgi:sec-independent protein translocase protein TatC
MADSSEDDLFKHTSMTFGEHLEELRACLFKAVLALTIGFGIGLFFANRIVQWVQLPLVTALEEYYKTEAVEYFDAHVPPSLRDDDSVKRLVRDQGLEPQEIYIAPGEILAALKQKYPDQFQDIELTRVASVPEGDAQTGPTAVPGAERSSQQPEANPAKPAASGKSKNDFVRIFIWHQIKDDERLKVKNFNVQESFMIWMKAGFLAGAILSSPFVFYFIWSFVAAGLYPHEKRYVHLFLPVSVGLFLSGAMLAFFFVFPPVLNFFFSMTKSMGQGIEPRISEWLSFVLLLPLGFGISFQLPLLMLFLERIHVFSVQVYLSKWRIAVLAMAVMSMVLSPGGDPYSMLMMLTPLVALYFGGIALCRWLPSNRNGSVDERRDRFQGGAR